MTNKTYCGFVAIVGRPNVGKSTLLNDILGKKLSITSKKPQTTRHQILGIKTIGACQTIYVDTPGMHKNTPKAINRYMNKSVIQAIQDVNAIVFVVDCRHWTDEDEMVLECIRKINVPIILAINKIDLIKDKEELLPRIDVLSKRFQFASIVPITALKSSNVDALEKEINQYMPECIHYFPDDEYTDRSMKFLAAEMIREKLMRALGEEVPYSISVVIEKYETKGKITEIAGLIYVERDGQKAIVIGKKGEMLKKIGKEARLDIEKMIGQKVFLQLWVKVKSGWSDNSKWLQHLGYTLD